jgi:hypothetical protein
VAADPPTGSACARRDCSPPAGRTPTPTPRTPGASSYRRRCGRAGPRRADVDARGDQLGRRVVPQLVQGRADPQPVREVAVALADGVGAQVRRAVRVEREHVGVRGRHDAEGGTPLLEPAPVLGQDVHRFGVERDAPVLVVLGVLLPRLAIALADAARHGDDPDRQIYVAPPQGAQLTTARAGDDREPDERSPVGLRPRGDDDLGRVLGRRRARLGLRGRRRLGPDDGVGGQPPPPHGALQGTAEDEVDLADRGGAEGAALVHPAACVALVRMRRPVVDVALAAAVVAAAPQLGVEGIEHARVECPDLLRADQRADVLLRVAGVGLARAALPRAHREVLIEQLVHRRVGARVPPLVDLVQQPRPGLLREPARLRPRRDHLDEVVPTSRHRVLARVDPHAECAAGQLVDRAAGAPSTRASSSHDASVQRPCVTSRVTRRGSNSRGGTKSQLDDVGRVGFEPTT